MISAYRLIRSVLLTVAAVIGVASILLIGAGALMRVSPLIVISGSMEPTIPTGSLLLSAERPASEVKVGDIVTVARPNGDGTVTHRVISVTPGPEEATTLALQGDANASADPEPIVTKSVGQHILTVPAFGYVAAFFQTVRGLIVAALLALALLALYFFEPKSGKPQHGRRRRPKNHRADTAGSADAPPTNS
ncbi:signal peptidase I [Leifsonia poae]|uniref:Signal peptidase I n=1 Tax=Leifsonia poae TaxID=110933 RepID=A0A9W6H792_9MICO|nr:signal peptidase I [Leifsonia poae]GLJ74709.1 signal peptidase I W [Leifsonia poae]